eukprot:PhF_6_TR26218/c0_g1_i4/m.37375/K16582/TTLL6_13; tubulin polyglutamylase TTLL6/13
MDFASIPPSTTVDSEGSDAEDEITTTTTTSASVTTTTTAPASSSATTAAPTAAPIAKKASSTGGSSSTTASAANKKKKKRKGRLIINCTNTRYPVIREVTAEMGFIEEIDEEDGTFSIPELGVSHAPRSECSFLWTDSITALARIVKLQGWQRYNHFPTMHLLARKVHLCHTLGRMRKLFPTYYTFYPRTWSLRSEKHLFRKHAMTSGKKTYIIKPNAGCQGRGIILTKDPLSIIDELDDYVAQEYVAKPLLIEGKKFDMRVYVLVTCVKPLSIFVYHEGLIRMCAEDYKKPSDDNIETMSMHLTNYAVNKLSDKYVFNEDEDKPDVGNKRNFAWFNQYVEDIGFDPKRLWDRIDNIACKALIAAQPQLAHVYSSTFSHETDGFACFEILGLDVLVDQQLKPWLLEVNHAPSLTCDTPLDHSIKYNLLKEAFTIACIRPDDKIRFAEKDREMFQRRMASEMRRKERDSKMLEKERIEEEEREMQRQAQSLADRRKHEDASLRGFRRVFPSSDPHKAQVYQEFLEAATEANAAPSTLATDSRAKELQQQRERLKQNESGSFARPVPPPPAPPPPPPVAMPPPPPPPPPKMVPPPQQSQQTTTSSSKSVGLKARTDSTARNVLVAINGDRKRVLEDQMLKHRRRMSLGPRVSVVQLREETQMRMESQQQQEYGKGGGDGSTGDYMNGHKALALRLREAIRRSQQQYGCDDDDDYVE